MSSDKGLCTIVLIQSLISTCHLRRLHLCRSFDDVPSCMHLWWDEIKYSTFQNAFSRFFHAGLSLKLSFHSYPIKIDDFFLKKKSENSLSAILPFCEISFVQCKFILFRQLWQAHTAALASASFKKAWTRSLSENDHKLCGCVNISMILILKDLTQCWGSVQYHRNSFSS